MCLCVPRTCLSVSIQVYMYYRMWMYVYSVYVYLFIFYTMCAYRIRLNLANAIKHGNVVCQEQHKLIVTALSSSSSFPSLPCAPFLHLHRLQKFSPPLILQTLVHAADGHRVCPRMQTLVSTTRVSTHSLILYFSLLILRIHGRVQGVNGVCGKRPP